MLDFLRNNRRWLSWALPSLALIIVIGVESDWGRALHAGPRLPPPAQPRPLNAALAPDYQLPGGIDAYKETIERPVFAPTRRQVPPPPPPTPPKPQIARGQFTLMGTTISKERSVALLREVASGKQKRVAQGEIINGLKVEKIEPNRVILRPPDGDETEVLNIQVALGPRPPVPAAGIPPWSAPPGMQPRAAAAYDPNSAPIVGGVPSAGAPTAVDGGAEQRRRAAAQPAAPQAAPQQQVPQGNDWNSVFQRMMQQSK